MRYYSGNQLVNRYPKGTLLSELGRMRQAGDGPTEHHKTGPTKTKPSEARQILHLQVVVISISTVLACLLVSEQHLELRKQNKIK